MSYVLWLWEGPGNWARDLCMLSFYSWATFHTFLVFQSERCINYHDSSILVPKGLKLIPERTIETWRIIDGSLYSFILLCTDGLTPTLKAEEWRVGFTAKEFLRKSF